MFSLWVWLHVLHNAAPKEIWFVAETSCDKTWIIVRAIISSVALSHPEMTVLFDWVLKIDYLSPHFKVQIKWKPIKLLGNFYCLPRVGL